MAKPEEQTKRSRKDDKKALQKALMDAFKLASGGAIAQTNHKGRIYLLAEIKPPLAQINHNGMPHVLLPLNVPQETKDLAHGHQKLLTALSVLNYEQKARSEFETDEQYEKHLEITERNENLFALLDEMTFEFAEGFAKKPHEQKKIVEKFNKILEENPIIDKLLEGKVPKIAGS